MAKILLADDDANLREVVGFVLADAGHEVFPVTDGAEAITRFDRGDIDLVLTDLKMPKRDGMAVLEHVAASAAPAPVIILTAFGTVEQAVAAMQAGADNYLLKPFQRDELRLVVERALRLRTLEDDNRRLRDELHSRTETEPFVYASAAMADVAERVRRLAVSDVTILIGGESGVGKELVARALHDLSPRWEMPFVAVSCGAIPADLLESELFGHARGAYTGADSAALGRFRAAAGGTLFLDEIGELPLSLQPKLLRAIESGAVDPVGGTGPVEVDFRLVCATNRDLAVEVAEGRFRADLYYRLNVVPIVVPPLRDRPEDIPPLWHHFTLEHGAAVVIAAPDLLVELAGRPWPGNVRELKNLNQRLLLSLTGNSMGLADLRRAEGASAAAAPASGLPQVALTDQGFSLPDLEHDLIRRALARCGGNKTRAAAYLGLPRHVLIYRLKKFGID